MLINERPFIVVFCDPSGSAFYQTEAECTTDYAFTSVGQAVEHIQELLSNDTIVLGQYSFAFVLNTVTGDSIRFKFEEQPRVFLAKPF